MNILIYNFYKSRLIMGNIINICKKIKQCCFYYKKNKNKFDKTPNNCSIGVNQNGKNRIKDLLEKHKNIIKKRNINYVARGSFGDIYTILDPSDKKTYAVKILKKNTLENIVTVERILNHLGEHPCILSALVAKPNYIIMEYSLMGDLCDYLINHGPPIDTVFKKMDRTINFSNSFF